MEGEDEGKGEVDLELLLIEVRVAVDRRDSGELKMFEGEY
jgi:hypothetical protein